MGVKKISLITLHSVQNYGSALQAYATQKFFEENGFKIETVDFTRVNNLKENLVDTALQNSRFWNKNSLFRKIFKILKSKDLQARYDLFDKFIKEHITLTEHQYLTSDDFKKYPIEADVYCTGSDQTWNTHWNRGFVEPYYLTYAPPESKKISFAASFGKNKLDEDEKAKTAELLSRYSAITVREQSGSEILAELGILSKRILDPTLMLDAEYWRSFAAERQIKGKYMLVYQLSHNADFDRIVKSAAHRMKLQLIRIGFGAEAFLYGGKVIKNPSVQEFLSLLANAEYIVTDSFHAVSFASNLNVKFLAWLPRDFSGRISEFLKIAGLENRVFNDDITFEKNIIQPIDFELLNIRLGAERRRSKTIILRMLEEN